MYIYMYTCMNLRRVDASSLQSLPNVSYLLWGMCVCVCEREREIVCVFVCACVYKCKRKFASAWPV